MCVPGLFGDKTPVSKAVMYQQVPQAPAAPPAPSAEAPSPDTTKSGEMENSRADRSGFMSLVIPRTAFAQASKNVASG